MYKNWYNSNADTAAEMLDVTDDLIRSWSSGEVSKVLTESDEDETEDKDAAGTSFDPAIFGWLDEDSPAMGHIELPIPVVNTQYLSGTKPILPKLLNMDYEDVTELVYYTKHLVKDAGETSLKCGDILSYSERSKKENESAEFLSGADAIEMLLGDNPLKPNIILHCIPVVPIALRLGKYKCEQMKQTVLKPLQVERLYRYLIFASNRVRTLMEMEAPSIIMVNECRMLQERVTALINNGSYGVPKMAYNGVVLNSLNELHNNITEIVDLSAKMVVPDKPDDSEVKEAISVFQNFENEMRETYGYAEDEALLLDEEDAEKEDLLIEDVCQSLLPYSEAIIDSNFAEYKEDYEEYLINSGNFAIRCAVKEYEGEPVFDYFVNGIYSQMKCFVNKRIMFC